MDAACCPVEGGLDMCRTRRGDCALKSSYGVDGREGPARGAGGRGEAGGIHTQDRPPGNPFFVVALPFSYKVPV